jgi:hypothetical protein
MMTSGMLSDFPSGLVSTPLQTSPQLLNFTLSIIEHPPKIDWITETAFRGASPAPSHATYTIPAEGPLAFETGKAQCFAIYWRDRYVEATGEAHASYTRMA